MKKNPIIVIGEKRNQDLYLTLFPADERIDVQSCRQPVDFNKCREVDLVLLDCGFSPQIGLSLLKAIKSSTQHVPVIFLTDLSSEGIAINAFRLGAIDYFKKPVNILALRNIIENLLRVKRSKRERRARIGNMDQETAFVPLTSDKPSFLFRTVRLVEDNLSSRVALKALASEANYSVYHFSRVFKKHMGMSPQKYVIFRRIERAKELLIRNEGMNISMVAVVVGFNDSSGFTKSFKKLTGVVPSAFRKVHRDNSP